MKDITRKVDRTKEILAACGAEKREPTDVETLELANIGIDVLGELVANSRRIAVALEQIAESQKVLAAKP